MKENNELTRDDIAIDHDMEVDCDEGREITVYIEAWFDVDKKFHIDTASDDDTSKVLRIQMRTTRIKKGRISQCQE